MRRDRDSNDGEFAEFVRRESPAAQQLANRITGDHHHAQDAVQAALARAYANWPKIRRMENPSTYVRRMVVNAAIDSQRETRRRRSREQLRDGVPEPGAVDAEPYRVDDRAEITMMLAPLTHQQRAVVILRFCEDLSEKETAKVLGISAGSVKTHSSRALAKLREFGLPAFEEVPDGTR